MSDMEQAKWIEMGRFMFHEQKLVEAGCEVDGLLRLLKPEAGARILDLPCGVGRHSIPLAKRGFQVTGVDITQEFIREAGRKADAEGVSLELLQGDMRSFKGYAAFDFIINLYTSFGYFAKREDDGKVMHNFFSQLKPGGKLLMDLMTKEIFVRNFKNKMERRLADGSIETCEHEVMNDNWLEFKWTRSGNGTAFEAKSGLRLYSNEELCEMLCVAGFSSVKSYGDFVGSEYSPHSGHLVLVAEK